MKVTKVFYFLLNTIFLIDIFAAHPPQFFASNFSGALALGQQQTQLISYKVGAGNCTLIRTWNNGLPVIIMIDAGSIDADGRAPDIKDKIIGDIDSHLNQANQADPNIYVIASHPANDHIQWIWDIINPANYTFGIKPAFYMGDRSNEIPGSRWKTPQPLPASPSGLSVPARLIVKIAQAFFKGQQPPIQFSLVGAGGAVHNPLYNHNLMLTNGGNLHFLFGEYLESENDNSESLVVKYEFGGVSALIPGDATSESGEAIFSHALLHAGAPLEVDILLASHHGATSHGSNSRAWAKAFNPQFVVFSSPGRGANGHPRCKAINNYQFPQNRIIGPIIPPNHNLTCFDGQQFGPLALHKAIYSTEDVGDIIFTWPVVNAGVNSIQVDFRP